MFKLAEFGRGIVTDPERILRTQQKGDYHDHG